MVKKIWNSERFLGWICFRSRFHSYLEENSRAWQIKVILSIGCYRSQMSSRGCDSRPKAVLYTISNPLSFH